MVIDLPCKVHPPHRGIIKKLMQSFAYSLSETVRFPTYDPHLIFHEVTEDPLLHITHQQ